MTWPHASCWCQQFALLAAGKHPPSSACLQMPDAETRDLQLQGACVQGFCTLTASACQALPAWRTTVLMRHVCTGSPQVGLAQRRHRGCPWHALQPARWQMPDRAEAHPHGGVWEHTDPERRRRAHQSPGHRGGPGVRRLQSEAAAAALTFHRAQVCKGLERRKARCSLRAVWWTLQGYSMGIRLLCIAFSLWRVTYKGQLQGSALQAAATEVGVQPLGHWAVFAQASCTCCSLQ